MDPVPQLVGASTDNDGHRLQITTAWPSTCRRTDMWTSLSPWASWAPSASTASFRMSIRTSRILFKKLLNTVLRTRLCWLDTIPVGCVLNPLTSDFEVSD